MDGAESASTSQASLNSWTTVDDADDRVGGWSGSTTSEDMSRDEDYLVIDGYLTACALTEVEAASCVNVKRTMEETRAEEDAKRKKT